MPTQLVSKHDSTIEFTSADTDSTVSDEPGVTVPRASPHDEDEDEDGYGDDSYGDDSPAVPAPAPAPVGAVAGKTGGEEDDGDDEYADDAHEEDDEDDEPARAMPMSPAHTAVAAVRAADATNHPPALLDRDRAGGVTPHSDMTSSDDDDEEEQGDCVADATGDLSPLTTRDVAGPGLSGVRRAERRRAGTLSHVPMVRQARHEQRLAHRATLSDHKDVAASQL